MFSFNWLVIIWRRGRGVHLKLDVQSQGGWRILKIGQFSWTSYVYHPFALTAHVYRSIAIQLFGLFLFLFWLYHLLLDLRKLLFYIHVILTKQLWLWNQKAKFSCFFLLKWWSIFYRTFVYDKNTLEVVSNAIKLEMQIGFFKSVSITIFLFSKNGVKDRLKVIFQT